jgi:hypothetical protein
MRALRQHTLKVYLTKEELATLKKRSEETGISMSRIIMLAVDAWLAKEKDEK